VSNKEESLSSVFWHFVGAIIVIFLEAWIFQFAWEPTVRNLLPGVLPATIGFWDAFWTLTGLQLVGKALFKREKKES